MGRLYTKNCKYCVRRIRMAEIKENCVKPSSYVFQDSSAYLGTAKKRSEVPVRVVGYQE